MGEREKKGCLELLRTHPPGILNLLNKGCPDHRPVVDVQPGVETRALSQPLSSLWGDCLVPLTPNQRGK